MLHGGELSAAALTSRTRRESAHNLSPLRSLVTAHIVDGSALCGEAQWHSTHARSRALGWHSEVPASSPSMHLGITCYKWGPGHLCVARSPARSLQRTHHMGLFATIPPPSTSPCCHCSASDTGRHDQPVSAAARAPPSAGVRRLCCRCCCWPSSVRHTAAATTTCTKAVFHSTTFRQPGQFDLGNHMHVACKVRTRTRPGKSSFQRALERLQRNKFPPLHTSTVRRAKKAMPHEGHRDRNSRETPVRAWCAKQSVDAVPVYHITSGKYNAKVCRKARAPGMNGAIRRARTTAHNHHQPHPTSRARKLKATGTACR